MQTNITNITNIAAVDAPASSGSQSNATADRGVNDRISFDRLVSRIAAIDARAEARAKEAKANDARASDVKRDTRDVKEDGDSAPIKVVRDTTKPDADKTGADKSSVKEAPDKVQNNTKNYQPSNKAAEGQNENTQEVTEDDSNSFVGGSLNPDVTAILDEASSAQDTIQAAGDTDLLTASTQPISLLALAAQMEKALAAMEAQKLAATKQNTPVNTLAMLSSPISAVVTEEGAPELLGDVTPLVDVLGEYSVELPGQLKPQTITLPTTNADAIINVVKQVAQPIVDPDQLQLNISAEEVIDPTDALEQVTKNSEVSKIVQSFLAEASEPEGAKSTAELLSSLKEVLNQRTEKDNAALLALANVPAHGVKATFELGDLGKDDSSLLNQGGNQSILSQLASDALRHTSTVQRNDATFSNMLAKTTNHVPVADQVLVNIKQAVADGASHIKIQLNPEELGRVDVRMSVGLDGKTSMTIMADNRDTLDMLQREARHLERALTDVGLKTDASGLSFHLRQQQQEQKFTRQQTNYASVAEVEVDETPVMTNMAAYRLTVNEGVDIKV
jgi:flagellar hook-length control protein FliK